MEMHEEGGVVMVTVAVWCCDGSGCRWKSWWWLQNV